jgi:seryl-tRNA synthetase
MTEPIDYPDLEPDGLGDLKSIRRTPQMKANAPQIAWGDEYKSWPIEKRLSYAERLASSMNHAAAVLQDERDRLSDVCHAQQVKVEQAAEQYLKQGDQMHEELARADAEKQILYAEIDEAKKTIKRLRLVCQAARSMLSDDDWKKARAAGDGG